MKTLATISLSVIAAFCFAVTATAQTVDDDPNVELRAIFDTLVNPAAKTANDAIAIAAIEPVKACQMAQGAAASFVAAQTRMLALSDRLDDPAPLQPSIRKITSGVAQFQVLAENVCNGYIASVQTNPATKPVAAIGAYVNAYTNDVIAANAAETKGDMTTYCALVSDGKVQLDGLTNGLAALPETVSLSSEEIAAVDRLGVQVIGFKADNDKRLQKCTAP